ncbi:hypothetical protein G6O69_00300 [Pseudenhygromyxa sp. WMMC2535]|uniref:hypothetical protein n=1 Tax=Pseudenhygromyxa sp. WMMC2535 TaxID=2712867 RepID=UPI001552CC94|nr:hypothetical protein [Pseudenhygromyxa sp. WMMC2535]NVB36250.1 hypothetical protein [Pseudenhygromyxa sp. WMMC2535]
MPRTLQLRPAAAPRAWALAALGVALGGALGLTPACEIPNEDHCLHKALDTNAWCAEAYPERPYCSPCTAESSGCVAEEPTAESCPSYAASARDDDDDDDDDDEGDEGDDSDETGTG